MRAPSQRLSTLVSVDSTAAAGGTASTRKSSRRLRSARPLAASGVPASVSSRSNCASALCRLVRMLSPSRPKCGMATMTESAPKPAAHATSRPGGYHSSAGAPPLPAPAPAGRASIIR